MNFLMTLVCALFCTFMVSLLMHTEGIVSAKTLYYLGSTLLVLILVGVVCSFRTHAAMAILQKFADLFSKSELNRMFSRNGSVYTNQVVRTFNVFTWSYEYRFTLTIWDFTSNPNVINQSIFTYLINAEVLESQTIMVNMLLPAGVRTPAGRIDRFQLFLRFNTEAPVLMESAYRLSALDPSRFKFVLTRVGDAKPFVKGL